MSLLVINPATEKEITRLESETPASVIAKYQRARAAQRDWEQVPFADKSRILSKFSDLLQSETEKLAQTLTVEMGKPIGQSRGEISSTPARVQYFLEKVESMLATRVVQERSPREEIEPQALGVIANISAWNYPYFVGSNVFVPALLTGNTVLYKPSEHAAMSGLAIEDLLHRAGVPEDVFICLVGAGEIGAALLKQDIDAVFFTGSVPTGKKVAAAAAERFIPVQLELGGKDPLYVCDDVDVAAVASAVAEGVFYNAGQSCCAVERLYVHQKIIEPFITAFLAAVAEIKLGDPTADSTSLGPLARKEQLLVLESQIADAIEKGAELLCGGSRVEGTGYYFEPSVLRNVSHKMLLMQEESFGPIIGVQSVAGDSEAIQLMNESNYGLTSAVYSSDSARAREILSQVNTGSAYVNCCDRVSPRLPWSGRNDSGIGCTLSEQGIRAFLRPKAWHIS